MSDDVAADLQPNPATIWAHTLVEVLVHCGLTDVCISPGSRSTPLTLAFDAHPGINVYLHQDERSASFFGLGMAMALDRPVALLCTSGTAGANYYPAVIEAYMSEVPLLVLTTDRPPELRHSGANQTIDQIRLFGQHVLWSVDAPLPEKDAPDLVLRSLRTLAARAYALADGLRKGPVHLNFPFRKPLEPSDAARPTLATEGGFTKIGRGNLLATAAQIAQLGETISRHETGLIVCGPRCPAGEFGTAVTELALRCGFPILADPLSGVRFGKHTARAPVCGAYETFLAQPGTLPFPSLILHFGASPTSNRLNDFLARCDAAQHVHVRQSGSWSDANHRTSFFLQANPLELCRSLLAVVPLRDRTEWLLRWTKLERAVWDAIDRTMVKMDFDAAAVTALFDRLPDNSLFFAGNSLPIRHIDQFARPSERNIHVYANRGASGIDGNISTGLGLALASGQETTILVGDITFYHDSNGLLGLRHLERQDLRIVVLNNDGGGIFQRLPISGYDPPFSELFRASHGLSLSGFAELYGLAHWALTGTAEFQTLLDRHAASDRNMLIEIKSDPIEDHQQRTQLEALVCAELARQLAELD